MRIVIGFFLGLLGLALYAAVVVTGGGYVRGLPALVELAYYVVAGVAWVPAARWLMYWSAGQRPG